jgi:type VI secretion system protein
MAGRGLLSRIGKGDASSRHDDPSDAILEHLRILLNTRRGEAPTVPDYGVPDMTDLVHTLPSGTSGLSKALRDTILTYEPRLKNVNVRNIPSDEPLVLRFEITARLVEDNTVLKLQTRVRAGGKIEVS